MRFFGFGVIGRGRAAVIAAVSLAALSTGCSSTDRLFGGSDQQNASAAPAQKQESTASRIAGVFLQKPKEPTPEEKRASVVSLAEMTCPPVDTRQGAATLTVPNNNTDPFTLRYQGTFSDMARECNVSNGVMRMKIGVEGRILVGPAGGAGTIDVPLRFAVVKEGAEPKTVVSKFSKFPVSVAEGQPNVIFTYVENEVAFPMPPDLEIDAYMVYVGFDPTGLQQQPAKKPAAKKPPTNPLRR